MRVLPRSAVTRGAALSGAVVVLVFVAVLLGGSSRLATTNTRVRDSAGGPIIAPGTVRCQGGEHVPAEAASARVIVGVPPGATSPPLRFAFGPVRGPAFVADLAAGYRRSGRVAVALPAHPDIELGQMCIENRGTVPVRLAGNARSANPTVPLALNGPGERVGDEVRIDYLLAGHPSWLSRAPRVVSRAALFRPGIENSGAIWLVLVLMILTSIGAVGFAVVQLRDMR